MSHKTMFEKDKMEMEKWVRPEELALLFIDFATQIREEGTLSFGDGELKLLLPRESVMELEVKAKCKKDKCKFALEVEWRHVVETPSATLEAAIPDAPPPTGDAAEPDSMET